MTALQQKLEKIGTDVGKFGLYAALLTIHILFLRFFVENLIDRSLDLYGGNDPAHPHGLLRAYLKEWLDYFIVGVAIIAVAVPEGLPLAVMISLAYSVRQMLKD